MTLLGDAAHAMTPDAAQGASQALEDAIALAQAPAETADVDSALRRYESRRAKRANAVVKQSRLAGRIAQISRPRACRIRNRLLKGTPNALRWRQYKASWRPRPRTPARAGGGTAGSRLRRCHRPPPPNAPARLAPTLPRDAVDVAHELAEVLDRRLRPAVAAVERRLAHTGLGDPDDTLHLDRIAGVLVDELSLPAPVRADHGSARRHRLQERASPAPRRAWAGRSSRPHGRGAACRPPRAGGRGRGSGVLPGRRRAR